MGTVADILTKATDMDILTEATPRTCSGAPTTKATRKDSSTVGVMHAGAAASIIGVTMSSATAMKGTAAATAIANITALRFAADLLPATTKLTARTSAMDIANIDNTLERSAI